jgi:Cu/Ag efflux protein CusF
MSPLDQEQETIMKKVLITALCFGMGSLSPMAFAASMSASGVVKSVDTKHDSITLADGSVYTLGEGFEAETFKTGQKVTISFKMNGGKMMASSVKVVK